MTTYRKLTELDLAALDGAVADWEGVARELGTLAGDARDGMGTRAGEADWDGANAAVTRRFVTATVDRFGYAHEHADGIRLVLGELAAVLRRCRTQLDDIAADADGDGLLITEDGVVLLAGESPYGAVQQHPYPDRRDNTGGEAAEREIAAFNERLAASHDLKNLYADRIAAVLAEAAEADETAARALREMAGEGHGPFTAGAYESWDDVEETFGRRAAEEVLPLLREGWDMSDEEAAWLNSVVEENKDNQYFAAALAGELGARGVLDFWTDMTDPEHEWETSDERRETLTALQGNLGEALGLATTLTDDPVMQQWRTDMIDLGRERLGDDVRWSPYGFQVMSNLMASGAYDSGFLEAYGEELIEFERDSDVPGGMWAEVEGEPNPITIGDAFRLDPMTGYMDALSHNPDAANTVFTDAETAEYLLTQRIDGHVIVTEDDQGRDVALQSTGNALFAATTGLDPDHLERPPTVDRDRQAGVLDRSLSMLAGTGHEFPPEFREPVAQILVNHGAEVHDTTSGYLLDTALDREDLRGVITEVSRDGGAYALLNEGLMHSIVGSFDDTETLRESTLDPGQTLDRAGQTVGYLEGARREAIDLELQDRGDDLAWDTQMAGYMTGTAASYVPYGGFAGILADAVITEWSKDEQRRIAEFSEDATAAANQVRTYQLNSLADAWYEINRDWADGHDRYEHEGSRYSHIADSAVNGERYR
ncbi:hypothetical protein [Streptomyces sp. RFCAC02]|uniref:hypothetical protein n=1 Tax=Streptomyces sp. RFCAC02 TaxID=2499143 RepID=UPI0010201A53|nr:hypothetical protein [Streptomyces sp. RFCAC02]